MRRFLFIDESGDPGLPKGGGSLFFVVAAVEISDTGLAESRRHLAGLRYFLGLDKEMKAGNQVPSRLPRQRSCGLLCELIQAGHAACSAVVVDKVRYLGPYLADNPVYFRNFTVRQLLETHFKSHPAEDQTEIELVFDRYTRGTAELQNLEEYLANNWRLPPFASVSHCDSEYVDALYWPDLVVSAVKEKREGVDGGESQVALCGLIPVLDATKEHA